jgi:hypothetical protein
MASKIKVLKVCGKTVDACSIIFQNEEGVDVGSRNDYVPNYFPEEHWGDYLDLHIDVETGMILNWKKPTQKELKDSITDKF